MSELKVLGETKRSVENRPLTSTGHPDMTITASKKSLDARTAATLVRAGRPGMWAARHGLQLVIAQSGSASWSLRYSTRDGKRRLMKLADYEPISAATLAALEAEAAEHRSAIKKGHDPLAERIQLAAPAARPVTPLAETFKSAALGFIAENRDGWKNEKHRTQWENSLKTYAYPIIGDKLVHEINIEDVKGVLLQHHRRGGPLWKVARETASRVRSRMEIVINATKARALADNSNPERQALWNNHHNPAQLAILRYAGLNGKQVKSHFKAMDWNDVPLFAKQLLRKSDYSAKALALTILCATRSNETFNATWSEIDLDGAVWAIPPERMKAGKEHRIPLSDAAVTLLRGVHRLDRNPFVFPGARKGQPLSNMAMLEMLRGMRPDERFTVHGFRSAFRDWITETTLHPDSIAEQALAHTIDNQVERAYRRGDAFDRRRDLMQQWADYLLIGSEAYAEKWLKFIA